MNGKTILGAVIGFIVGPILTSALGIISASASDDMGAVFLRFFYISCFVGPFLGAMIGGLIGASMSKQEVSSQPDSESTQDFALTALNADKKK